MTSHSRLALSTLEYAASSAWGLALIATVVLMFGIATTAQSPSTRLTRSERGVKYARIPAKFVAGHRAPLLLPRHNSWNELVTREDKRRLRSTAYRYRRDRRLFWIAIGASLCVVVAAALSASHIFGVTAETGVLTRPDAVKFAGLLLAAMCGWISIPAVTSWLVQEAGRSRMPLEWRLLARGATLSSNINVDEKSWIAHELPRAGRISVTRAEALLRPMEDEILATLAPRGSRTPEAIRWRAVDAPRVALLLDAKTKLLDQSNGEVSVERVYDWLDLVATTLVGKRNPPKAFSRSKTPPDLLQAGVRAGALRSLGLRFRRVSGLLSSVFLLIPLSIVAFGGVYPVIRSFLTPYPDLLGAVGVVAGLIFAQILAVIVARASKRD